VEELVQGPHDDEGVCVRWLGPRLMTQR
jgi:hypothetical protein